MATHNANIENLRTATLGEQVRGSMIQLFEEDYNLVKRGITIGTDVTSASSATTGYYDGNVYINSSTLDIWKLIGTVWTRQGNLRGISNISEVVSTVDGGVNTITITLTDGTQQDFTIKNGKEGVSIVDVTKTSTIGNVDHYDISLSDGSTTPNGIDIKNGVSVSDITLKNTIGNTKTYEVNLSDGTTTPNTFNVTDGTSNYVHIRYSAQFDGTGMVSIPTAQTVYIGIVVTTQSVAPTDPSVYSWVKFIGDSGSGTGDMLKSDFSTRYNNVVDKASALYDGTNEILANELLDKTSYATKGVAGTVDKATQLVDVTNSKTADTVLLANLTDDGATGLKYKGKEIGGTVKIDNTTITKNASDELTLDSSVVAKLPKTTPTTALKGQIPIVQADGSVEWGNGGGHDMLNSVSDVEALTSGTDNKVVNAYTIKQYSNRYTDSVIATLTANNNQVTITDNLLKNNNATYEFMFEPTLNASGEYEVMTLAKYTLDTTSGVITIDVVEAPTVNTRVRVDITSYRA